MPTQTGHQTDRRTAVIVGVLFLVALFLYLIGTLIYGRATESEQFLERAYPDRGLVTLGVLIEFVAVLAIPLIGFYLFPVLRRFSEALALAYVGFRSLEAVFLLLIETKLLALIDVSQRSLDVGGDSSGFQTLGDSLLAEKDTIFQLYVLVFAIGALILYALLYRSRLVPRWLSIWGFAAAAWMGIGNVLSMFDVFSNSSASLVEATFVIPVPLNELVLAGWLIVKGFNQFNDQPSLPDGREQHWTQPVAESQII